MSVEVLSQRALFCDRKSSYRQIVHVASLLTVYENTPEVPAHLLLAHADQVRMP